MHIHLYFQDSKCEAVCETSDYVVLLQRNTELRGEKKKKSKEIIVKPQQFTG